MTERTLVDILNTMAMAWAFDLDLDDPEGMPMSAHVGGVKALEEMWKIDLDAVYSPLMEVCSGVCRARDRMKKEVEQ